MERLIVEPDCRVIIPADAIRRRGFFPGDELTLVEVAEGLLIYGMAAETAKLPSGLSEEDQRPKKLLPENPSTSK